MTRARPMPGTPKRPLRRFAPFPALLALLLVFGATGAPPAHAQEWTYTAQRGDNLWELATDFLVSMRHWPAFRALNDVPNPRAMPPGTRVRFPAAWLRVQPAPATVVAVSGGAQVADAGGALAPAREGQALAIGARVVTAGDGSAVLRFADGATMLVRPGSEVHLDDLGLYGRRAMVDTRARMQRGGVEVEVPPAGRPGNRMTIDTPSASALVRGTRFRAASAADATRTEVVEGRVRVANDAGRVDLPAGTGTLVRAGEPPAPPRTLLPAPSLDAVAARLERRQLRLGWAAVEGASGYRAQIATVADVPVLLLDLASDTPRLELPDLPDGRYALRVRAVDELGLEGLESQRVFELDARPEPPATLEPRPAQTVRTLRPALRWSAPADAVRYRVQLAADAGFAQPLADRDDVRDTRFEPAEDLAAGTWHWRLATIDASGEQGPFGDVQSFTVRPEPPAPGEAEAAVSETEVLLRWQAGQPGQSYEVEIASAEDFSEGSRIEPVAQPQLALETPPQDIWFRVRIVDTDGYRGPFGTPQRIEVPKEHPWWLLAVPLLLLIL